MTDKTIGKYEIIETLGQGGYGIVYRVRDTILNVDRALKVLHPVLLADPTFIERFKREAQIMARLEHPNIVQVYDMDQISEHVYISMKYVSGGSLKEILKQQGRLSFERALEIANQIASALEYAYNQPEKLIHRDIKPSNILFERDGSVRLSDFGFAKALSRADSISLSASGGMINTPNYMAPEIWRGKSATSATDVYSLACVFYEMITGEILFPGESPPEIITIPMLDGTQYPNHWNEGIPEQIETVLNKALSKDIQERYQIAGEFVEALGGLHEVDEKEKAVHLKEEKTIKTAKSNRGVEINYEERKLEEGMKEIESEIEARKTEQFAETSKKEELSKKRPEEIVTVVKIGQTEIPRKRFIGIVGASLLLIILCIGILIWIVATLPFFPTVPSTVTMMTNPTVNQEKSGAFVDDHGVEMAWIPAGSFMMGAEVGVGYQECQKYSDDCEERWFEDEQPIHEVYLDTYAIDVYEVTNELFAAFLNAEGNQEEGGATWLNMESENEHIYESGGEWEVESGYGDHPVIEVTWYGVRAYCEWRGVRLPTEAEWEKAARGGLVGKLYPLGDEEPTCQKGAKNGAQYDECDGDTVVVGSFAANGYGLYDMAGNVWEWVLDWYNEDYYGISEVQNPLGPSTGEYRVLRGGSWLNNPFILRIALRFWNYPGIADDYLGFRCASSP